jgi:hypothetical protein
MLACVPFPSNISVPFDNSDSGWAGNAAIQEALARLTDAQEQMMAPAKKCVHLTTRS